MRGQALAVQGVRIKVMLGMLPLSLLVTMLVMLRFAHAGTLLPDTWISPYLTEHPFVGRIVDGGGNAVTEEQLLDRADEAAFLLIGEIHTNKDHHQIQAILTDRIGRHARASGLVWEMVPQSLQSVLDEAKTIPIDQLGERLSWSARGWGDWSDYQPIAEAAIMQNMAMRAGGFDRDLIRGMVRQGRSVFSDADLAQLGLDRPLSKIDRASLHAELLNSHCGLLPESALPGMVFVQRARDGAMASALKMINRSGASAVLIAGNGHVRKDRGVPRNLPGDKGSIVSIGLVEAPQSSAPLADLLKDGQTGKSLYDFVIITPRSRIDDPCEAMRKQFSKPSTKKARDGD